jgi:copper chaperone CopZ
MKNPTKTLTKTLAILVASICITLLSTSIQAEPSPDIKSTVFTVNGMVCAFCAQGIEKKLAAMPAVQSVHVNLEKKIVVVETKPGQTLDTTTVIADIKDAGYDVTHVETVEKNHESP